jgi:lipopolysaccharide/colanic/teichoic acid biosynthesis glycosyltransferase
LTKRFFSGLFLDGIIVTASFLITAYLKSGGRASYYSRYYTPFLLFLSIWVIISLILKKYDIDEYKKSGGVFRRILVTNFIIFCVTTSLIYLSQDFNYSRFIILGTLAISTLAEVTLSILYSFVQSTIYDNGHINNYLATGLSVNPLTVSRIKRSRIRYDYKARIEFLKKEIGEEAFNFILPYGAIDSPNVLVMGTTTRFTLDAQIQPFFDGIINVNRVNDFRYINKFFEAVNSRLPKGGIYIDFFESKSQRKKRILSRYPPVINYIIYVLDFLVNRAFPKFALTKKLYFFLSRGENRVLSKAEAFGRLYSCGFEVLDEKLVGNNLFFVALKVREPYFPRNPSYGPVVALERIGKGGKSIKVYKMRTMHPYAEYLQDYIYKKGGLQEGGKFRDDFRVTTLGRIMRMFWIDELPMVFNFIKGDLKIVGVRPLSRQYYKLYSPELQKHRIKTKPGLIPPFYVDYPKTLEDIMESEMRYLKAYEEKPLRTDWNYFWKSVFNIVFRKYRSR